MKKLFVLAVSALMLFSSASSAHAFSFGDFASRFRGEAAKESFENKGSESGVIKSRNREEQRERLRTMAGIMINRYESTLEKLETLIVRIETRIAKIKEEDPEASLAAVEKQIKTAKDKLELVGPKIEKLRTDLEAMASSENPKELFATVLSDARSVKADLVSIHKILVQVIGDIKGLRIGNEK